MGILAPIYFCPVGTVLAYSLKIVSAVVCYARLCTGSNLLLISRFRIPFSGVPPKIKLEKVRDHFVTI